MMKKLGLCLIIVLMTFTLGMGETFSHKNAGMSIWFPDSWKTSTEGDMLEATAPDGDAYIQLLALENVESMEEAVNAYAKEMDKLVSDFKTTSEGENSEINGLSVFYVDGEGKVEGVAMDISLSLVVTRKAIVMVVAFSAKAATEKYAEDFEDIVASVKAI